MEILVDEAEEGQRPDGELRRAREGRAASQEARGLRGRRRRNRGPCRPLQQLEAEGRLNVRVREQCLLPQIDRLRELGAKSVVITSVSSAAYTS